jgi:hypothetical protein
MVLSGTPKVIRQESTINNYWSTGSPDPSIPSDKFSARWTKTDSFQAGTYVFSVTADDGVQLLIDGQVVIDKWFDQSESTYSFTKQMTAGPHTIIMKYYEDTGTAVAKLIYYQN